MAEVVHDDQLPAGAGTAQEVAPIPAASVLLLRDDPLEVLMIRRHEKSSFVPNAWVFPGGVLEESDADSVFLNRTRIAAARELFVTTLQESEAVDSVWISPADAVQRHMAGNFPLVFPTLKNLEAIAGFRSARELMDSRRNVEIPTTQPVLIIENGQTKIVLP